MVVSRFFCFKTLLPFGLAFIVLGILSQAAVASTKDIKEILGVQVHLRVSWDIDSGDLMNKGFLDINVKGSLRHNRQWSSAEEGMMTVFVPYVGRDMRASYRYREEISQKNPPEGCPALLAEYSGRNVVTLPPVPGPGNLVFHYLGNISEQTGMGQFVPPQVQGMFKNYYDFFLAAAKEEISGRRRGYNDCKFKEDSKVVPIGAIGFRFLIEDKGRLEGRRSWTSDKKSGRPVFQVRVSNLAPMMEKNPFQPKKEEGPVSYQLSWTIEETAIVEIQRRVKGEWKPLTEDLKQVVVGERVELRGRVLPAEKDPGRGDWTIDGRNCIKEFKADKNRGEAVPLEESDLKNKSVVFYWYQGGRGKVRYAVKVDGEEYSKEEQFKIEKPDYEVTWENSPDSHFGELSGGNPALRDKWPKGNWPPEPPQYSQEGLSGVLTGLEYNGILFQCRNKSDIKGRTQWVQLVRETQKSRTADRQYVTDPHQGLDHVYPCAVGDSFYDAPALPTRLVGQQNYLSWFVDMDFDLYLMFMPEGEGNEWVPLKLIKWGWRGMIKRAGLNFPWEEELSVEPHRDQGTEPTQTEAKRYPEWTP